VGPVGNSQLTPQSICVKHYSPPSTHLMLFFNTNFLKYISNQTICFFSWFLIPSLNSSFVSKLFVCKAFTDFALSFQIFFDFHFTFVLCEINKYFYIITARLVAKGLQYWYVFRVFKYSCILCIEWYVI